MIAYDKVKLQDSFLIREGKALFKKKFISKAQLADIANRPDKLNTNDNLLIRCGFFLLGCFLFSSVIGSFGLMFASVFGSNFEIIFFMYALFGFVGSEVLAKRNYLAHGLDDAFVLSGQLAFYIGVGMASEATSAVAIAMIVLGIVCCIRYVNTISALISCVGLVVLLFDLITEQNLMPKALLPFVGLLLAIAIYMAYKKLSTIPDSFFYRNALQLIKIFSLLLGYFSMNYMVVRELSQELMNIVVVEGADIPFAPLFYILTFAIPIAYLVFALQKKDRIMLLIGLFTFGYSIFTIRYYHSILPLETALTLGGIVLFAFSFFVIRKLQHRKTGITFEPDRDSNSGFILNAQALLVNAQVDVKPIATPESDMPFGGGGFSGGGAGESY
jgi:hypothetical protein